MKKTLAAYFSASGVTAEAAKNLQRQQGQIYMKLSRLFHIQIKTLIGVMSSQEAV